MAKFFKGFFTQGERVLRDETQSCKLTFYHQRAVKQKKERKKSGTL